MSTQILSDSDWIKKHFRQKYIYNLLDYQKKYSYKLILKHNRLLKQYYSRQLWSLVTLALCHEIFVEDIHYGKVLIYGYEYEKSTEIDQTLTLHKKLAEGFA